MRAKIIFLNPSEADLFLSDGGVATFHHNGNCIITTYYQNRVVSEELKEDQTIWDQLAEGKSYSKEWDGKSEIDDEVIKDAINWLAPMFIEEIPISKIYL